MSMIAEWCLRYLPLAFGLLGWAYGAGAIGLGAWFTWDCWRLLRNPDRLPARKVFFASMIYLVGLFIAVLVDVNL